MSIKKITATDTLELSIPERIQLVEDIWDTIAAQADSLDLTDNEIKTIDDRLTSYHNHPELGAPWKEIYKNAKQNDFHRKDE